MRRTGSLMMFTTWFRRWSALIAFTLLQLCAGSAAALTDSGKAAVALRSQYEDLAQTLRQRAGYPPLHLSSTVKDDMLRGEVYGVLPYGYDLVRRELSRGSAWCDVVSLHPNVKGCRTGTVGSTSALLIHVGRKHYQSPEDAYAAAYAFRVLANEPDYLRVELNADEGPLGTRDYEIRLEAIPLGKGRTFLHFSYVYEYGVQARMALNAYLGTVGRDKVGFTVTGKDADGRPVYIGGVRGVVERNTVRYYLALESYFAALQAPPEQQLERRLRAWFAATERYPRQLRELDRDEYLEIKRREHEQTAATSP